MCEEKRISVRERRQEVLRRPRSQEATVCRVGDQRQDYFVVLGISEEIPPPTSHNLINHFSEVPEEGITTKKKKK